MRNLTSYRVAALLGVLIGLWSCSEADAQVRSVTLGIRTHCPYGIRGCWPEIRDGLETPKAIDVICGEPDIKTDTCEVKMRDDWIADPDMFQRNFLDMSIGVDVRGVEATVDGRLEQQGTNLVLRLDRSDKVMYLAPLKKKVQWDKERMEPASPTVAEQKAFKRLVSQLDRLSGPVRVVGPLSQSANSRRQTLEVREFAAVSKLTKP